MSLLIYRMIIVINSFYNSWNFSIWFETIFWRKNSLKIYRYFYLLWHELHWIHIIVELLERSYKIEIFIDCMFYLIFILKLFIRISRHLLLFWDMSEVLLIFAFEEKIIFVHIFHLKYNSICFQINVWFIHLFSFKLFRLTKNWIFIQLFIYLIQILDSSLLSIDQKWYHINFKSNVIHFHLIFHFIEYLGIDWFISSIW